MKSSKNYYRSNVGDRELNAKFQNKVQQPGDLILDLHKEELWVTAYISNKLVVLVRQ